VDRPRCRVTSVREAYPWARRRRRAARTLHGPRRPSALYGGHRMRSLPFGDRVAL